MFFEKFREAWARLPAGLIRAGAPAPAAAVEAAERALGRSVPDELRSFLLSFDGADLFHGSVVVAGVGPDAIDDLKALNESGDRPPEPLVFPPPGLGDRFALHEGGRA